MNPLSLAAGREVNADPQIFWSDRLQVFGRGVFNHDRAYDGAHEANYVQQFDPGNTIAKITASGLWVPTKRTAVTSGGGATAQAIPVVNARFFKAGDTISVGADTGKTIASVNYSTNTITVSDTAFTFANNEAVIGSG